MDDSEGTDLTLDDDRLCGSPYGGGDLLGRGFGPRRCAALCGRRLTDKGSIQCGHGPECESDLIMAKGVAETDSLDPIEAIRQLR